LIDQRQLRRLAVAALGGEQQALLVEPAGIAAERPVAADHAVARDEHRDMVVAVGRADRSDRGRLADRRRDLGIAAGLARRDLAQLAPHRFLEGGAGDVDRQVGHRRRMLDRRERAFDQLLEAAGVLDDRGLGEQPPQRRLAVVEGQAADPLRRRGDQHLAERAVEMGPADGLAAAAVAPGRWGHAEPLLGVRVKDARPRIAGVVDRVGHPAVSLERALRPLVAQAPRIFRRGHAEVALEQALEMMRGIAHRLSQLGEARRLFGPLDQLHRLGHGLAVAADRVGLAPEARTITGRARFLGRRVEGHILALRPLRRAARLAIDAGGMDRADHPAVPAAVKAHERRPRGVGIEARNLAHAVRSRRANVGGKRGHDQFLSILAEKQPRVALWAWMVATSGLANSRRIPESASPGWVRIASTIIPSRSNPRSDSTRGPNTGGTASTYSAGSWSPSVTKIAWLARYGLATSWLT